MPDRRREDDPVLASVRVAMDFVVKAVDRLDDSIVRLQQTVREDFATVDELDVVKSAVQQLREDVSILRRRVDAVEELPRKEATLSKTEVKIGKYFIWVAIPAGVIALVTLAWEIYQAMIKKVLGLP